MAAIKLSITTSPATANAGVAVAAVIVQALDVLDILDITYAGSVTLAVTSGPAIGGTLTVTAVAGIATFAGLVFLSGGTSVYKATASGLTDSDTASTTVSLPAFGGDASLMGLGG